MHFSSAVLAAVALASAANATVIGSSNVQAAVMDTAPDHLEPRGINKDDGPNKSKHHVRFHAFDGPTCHKEHDRKDFRLNADGTCAKLPKMVYRSLQVERASRSWDCDVKVYTDTNCANHAATVSNINPTKDYDCFTWQSEARSQVNIRSARLRCRAVDDDRDDEAWEKKKEKGDRKEDKKEAKKEKEEAKHPKKP